jgi:hypothetical protein
VDAGSVAAGAWIARFVFLILVGWALLDGKRGIAIAAVLLGAGVWLAVPRLNPQLVTPCLAIHRYRACLFRTRPRYPPELNHTRTLVESQSLFRGAFK